MMIIDSKPLTSHRSTTFFDFPAIILITVFACCLAAFTPDLQTGPVHKRAKTQPRPALSGPEQIYATEQFLIHYTLEGDDAVSPTDRDGNSYPDYVEAVAEALQFSWQRQVEELGWRAPVPDQGEGGDTRFDVYLENQGGWSDETGLFGYVETHGGAVGDNPVTEIVETGAAYGYLSLDNDYSTTAVEYDLPPLGAMQTTAAHELHHAIQAAYDDGDPYEWLYEASAVWMEDEIYPDIGDAKSYLADYMAAPDICPLSVGRDDQDVRWYGGWILLRYLAEHYGGPETVRRLWDKLVTLDGRPALEATLAEQNSSLAELLVNFSIANLVKSDCPANSPYCYAEGSSYLRPKVKDSIRVAAGAIQTLVSQEGVQQWGTDYIRLKGEAPIQIDFQGSPAGQWHLTLVGLTGDRIEVTPWSAAAIPPTNPADFDRLYLVVVNSAPVEAEAGCGYHNYALAFGATAEAGDVTAPSPEPDPGPYVPTPFEAAAEEDFLPWGRGQPISLEDAPYSPLLPGYLPGGYSLSRMARYSAHDLGEWVQEYAPGGEPVIGLEFAGPNNQYISIFQSPAPPQTIHDWANRLGYSENDIRLVNNQPTFLVDLSDNTGQLSNATFVHHDLFVVIDGTVDLIEIQQIVAGLLANN